MIKFALILTAATYGALIHGIEKFFGPFQFSIQYASGKSDLSLGGHHTVKTELHTGRTDFSKLGRGAEFIGCFTVTAGRAAPYFIF